MSDDIDWERAKDVVHEALIRPPAERVAFVRAACGSNEALHAEVVSLLSAHAEAGTFAEQPAFQAIGDWNGVAADSQTADESVLQPGDRIGPYRVEEPIGAGGMGQVYRAHDTTLGRDVAIKVLPAAFSTDHERLARFEREARVLATLKHPHIATIYGIEHVKDVPALVLELIDGSTLTRRLEQSRLPMDEALTIARQLTEALEAAHEKGIVHRDLKPANILLQSAPGTIGSVKVVDFGLAKTDDAAGEWHALTAAHTDEGRLLGTLGYMSPEQARGQRVDKRTDIWAFGCVLFEMLAGAPAFPGATRSDQISAILDRDPDWSALPSRTPPAIDRLLRRCLEKDLTRRLRDVGDARIDIDDARAAGTKASPTPNLSRRQVTWSRTGWAVAALSVVTMLAIVAWYWERESANGRVVRLAVLLPEKTIFDPDGNPDGPALSPNGRSLAFAAAQATGDPVLWIRSLDVDVARPLPGTEGAHSPFWSPDSESLGFFANGKLKRVPASGGTPQVLCEARTFLGGTWSQDGIIVFVPEEYSHLVRVSANGGTPTPATTLDQAGHELMHLFPQFLPDGRHFLYLALTARQADSVIYVGALGSAQRTMVMRGLTSVAYDPSGRLLFGRDGILMAQPFDLTTFTLSGEPTTIAERAYLKSDSGSTLFSASANGIVAYRNSEPLPQAQLTWVDRRGKPLGAVGPPGTWLDERISPDGKKVALMRQEAAPAGADLWLLDLGRGTITRFTDDPSWDQSPIWSPDGRRIVFSSDRAGPRTNLYVRASDGATKEERLRESSWEEIAMDWSPDGTSVIYWTRKALWQLPLRGDRKPVPLVQNNFNNVAGRFSPDGRWLAYQSDESGRMEIYSQPLTTPGERVRVSSNGGFAPRWRADGKELFYRDFDNRVIAVELRREDFNLKPGSPSVLFSLDRSVWWSYDVASDGQRFLVPIPVAGPPSSMTVVLNWTELLNQRVSTR